MKIKSVYKNFLNVCVFLTLVIGFLAISSCRHGSVDEYVPYIDFNKESSFLYSDTTIESGEDMFVGFEAKSNNFSGAELRRAKITVYSNGSGIVLLDTSISSTDFNYSFRIPTIQQNGNKEYEIVVTDCKNKSITKSLLVEFFSLNPIVEFVADSGFVSSDITMQQNRFFRVGINASSSSFTLGKLNQIIIKRKYGSLFITEVDSSFSGTDFFSADWYFVSNDIATSEEWWFIVKDEYDRVGFASFVIVTNMPQTPMNLHFTESVFNGLGTNNYGWDFLNDSEIFWEDPSGNKDFVNDTAYVHLIEPFYFKQMFKSENSTKFVKANYFDFENAPYEDAVDIFTGATISNVKTYISNFSEEDIFIAKLRELNEYVAIKIVNIELTTDDNLDRVDFEYKKVGD